VIPFNYSQNVSLDNPSVNNLEEGNVSINSTAPFFKKRGPPRGVPIVLRCLSYEELIWL